MTAASSIRLLLVSGSQPETAVRPPSRSMMAAVNGGVKVGRVGGRLLSIGD